MVVFVAVIVTIAVVITLNARDHPSDVVDRRPVVCEPGVGVGVGVGFDGCRARLTAVHV